MADETDHQFDQLGDIEGLAQEGRNRRVQPDRLHPGAHHYYRNVWQVFPERKAR